MLFTPAKTSLIPLKIFSIVLVAVCETPWRMGDLKATGR